MFWGIHTVYIPRENIFYLEEWLAFHSMLGAEYFVLYDNTGSRSLHLGNSVAFNGKNKYGWDVNDRLTDGDINDLQREIFKKYNVKHVVWQPIVDGYIAYHHIESFDHFAEGMKEGWCAFIDMDEFLVPEGCLSDMLDGDAVRVLQKKFKDRFYFNRALDCEETFSINTKKWAPKIIFNMSRYVPGWQDCHRPNPSVNVRTMPFSQLRYNHYNHNPVGHQWLLENKYHIDLWWRKKSFEDVFTSRCNKAKLMAKSIDYSKFVNTKK